ncbi:MAG: dehydrogenase subunit [Ignavibacteria bacterium]|nr:dehydrogenase subunit [Ignavibacteria bacterium]
MNTQEIFEVLKEKFGDTILEVTGEAPSDLSINVVTEKIADVCLFLRDTEIMNFDYLSCLSGMDYKDSLGVVYHLYSTINHQTVVLKVKTNRENPSVPTVERIWKTANWHEREAYDMYGIQFAGHPNMIRILTCYDWEGWPLRKDYKTPEAYHGIKVPY